MLDKLKAAGFNWLAVGIEAGADRVRTDVDKAFSQEQVYGVVRDIQSAGISVIGNYIFGLPEDDLTTMRATLDLALDLKCEFGNFYSAMAYPGSPLYSLAVSRGGAAAAAVDRLLAALTRSPAAADTPSSRTRGTPLPRCGVPGVLHRSRISRYGRTAIRHEVGRGHPADDRTSARTRPAHRRTRCARDAPPRGRRCAGHRTAATRETIRASGISVGQAAGLPEALAGQRPAPLSHESTSQAS